MNIGNIIQRRTFAARKQKQVILLPAAEPPISIWLLLPEQPIPIDQLLPASAPERIIETVPVMRYAS